MFRFFSAFFPWKRLLFISCLAAATLQCRAQVNDFWRRQSIYQIVTDRFYNGDPGNDNAEGTYAPGDLYGIHGGDFKGIQQKLSYIKSLGATAVWISPIVLNTEGQFHGYSAWDFNQVAPHWGSIADLQNLVKAAHSNGLLVIDDIVVNHAGDLVTGKGSSYPNFNYPAGYTLSYVNSFKPYPAPFNISASNPSLTNLFHNYGNIANFNDTNQLVLGSLSGLNDFTTETPYVRSNMIAIYESWIKAIGFDGFRIDTALEVEMGFWQTFCPAIHSYAPATGNSNFFMFGEAYTGNESQVGSYTGSEGGGPFKFDSMLDYPLFFINNSVFAKASGNTAQIENHYSTVDANYDPSSQKQLVTFLDNHDNPRFLSTSQANGNTNNLQIALVFLYTSRGIPCLYYGTEQAFNGATDPYDREDMFAGQFKDGPVGVDSFNETHPLFLWIALMNNFRRLYPSLQIGSHVNQWNNPNGPGLFAYSRVLNSQEVFVVLNTATTNQTLPARTLTYPAGTLLVNLLNTNETITLNPGSQTPAITLAGTSAKMFIQPSQWRPLDPVVLTNCPVHDATNVSLMSPVVIHFSKPMNTNSVQSAFSINPPASGTFSWSDPGDTMTFTPSGNGLAGLTNVSITISNSANDAVTGKPLYAPYTLLFHTAAPPPLVHFSSPATDGIIVQSSSNATYLIQVCFTPSLDTNTASLFHLTINGVLQPQSSYLFRPPGAVAGCPGLRSLLYNWSGYTTGSNVLNIVYSNNAVVLSDSRSLTVAPQPAISNLTGNNQRVVWSSVAGVKYELLATTNLSQPFAPISGVILATNSSTAFLDLSNTPPARQKFYEIEIVP